MNEELEAAKRRLTEAAGELAAAQVRWTRALAEWLAACLREAAARQRAAARDEAERGPDPD